MLTEAKLKRFVKVRNESEFNSNLQFWSDATDCGFCIKELGDPEKVDVGHYRWKTPFGDLVEQYGKCRIE